MWMFFCDIDDDEILLMIEKELMKQVTVVY